MLDRPNYDRWAVSIGQVVNNCRTPLDQIVCALAMSNKTDPDGKTSFPVFNDRDNYNLGFRNRTTGLREVGSSGLRKVERIDGKAQAVIESLQPYHGHETGRGLLLLDQLWRTDKHLVPLSARGRGHIDASVFVAHFDADVVAVDPFPYEHNATAAHSDRPVDVHLKVAVEVCFRDRPPWGKKVPPYAGLPVGPTLKQAVKAARHVLSELEPLVPR